MFTIEHLHAKIEQTPHHNHHVYIYISDTYILWHDNYIKLHVSLNKLAMFILGLLCGMVLLLLIDALLSPWIVSKWIKRMG